MTRARFLIAPSLLAADLARLGHEVAAACAAGADLIPQFAAAGARARIEAHAAAGGARALLEIDGGVKPQNIGAIAARGCDAFVVGSAFFGAGDANGYRAIMRRLRKELAEVPERRRAA
jgi:pentose-5-phosphate-3-epimerase